MAEAIARRAIAERTVAGVTVGSAGVAAHPGAGASEGARRVAAEAGLGLDGHRSMPLTEEVVAASDLVLCMDGSHLRRARELGGGEWCRPLAEAAGERGDVVDPFGGPDETYRAVFNELARLVGAVLDGIAPTDAGRRAARRGAAAYAVLGDPVAHSLSPTIHNAAFRADRRDAVYVARRVSAGECGGALRGLALGGGGGNVTAPHKERVLPFLDRRTAAVDATGACNTFWAKDGEVWGDNTDVEGFRGTWDAALEGVPGAVAVLLLGAGGAARAVLHSLLGSPGVAGVLVWNRTGGRAKDLVRRFADPRVSTVRELCETAPAVLVNATSAGMDDRAAPLDLRELAVPPRRVIDLVYRTEPTPLCLQAADMGIPAVDGRDMLVRQAEASYLRWFGEPPAKGVMTRALG